MDSPSVLDLPAAKVAPKALERSSIVRWLSGCVVPGLIALGALGCVLHFTVRDRFPFVAIAYYALPRPVLLLLTIAAWRCSTARTLRRRWLLAAALCLTGWVWISDFGLGATDSQIGLAVEANTASHPANRPPTATFTSSPQANPERVLVPPSATLPVDAAPRAHAAPDGPQPVKILFWNVARGLLGWENIIATLQYHSPDVVAMVEAAVPQGLTEPEWQARFPGYEVYFAGGQKVLLVRGRIRRKGTEPQASNCTCAFAELLVCEQELPILLIDICGRVDYNRQKALAEVQATALRWSGKPFLLLGDFNVPLQSAGFDLLRKTCRPVLSTYGRGYLPTWPMPLPVLQLDHAWAGTGLQVVRAETLWTIASDHRPLLLEVLAPPPLALTAMPATK